MLTDALMEAIVNVPHGVSRQTGCHYRSLLAAAAVGARDPWEYK